MIFTFRCNRCLRLQERNIPLSDYDKEKGKQVCAYCPGKTIMERVIEWEGPATNLGGYSDVAGNAHWQA